MSKLNVTQKLIKTILKKHGFQIVFVAESGEQALNMIKKDPPDLILLDIFMPGIEGYEICEKLKKNFNELKIISQKNKGLSGARNTGLKNAKHRMIYPDNTDNDFDNLGHHVRIGMRSLRPLKKGESMVVPVMAHQYHNRTGVLLERGRNYSFKVKPGQKWKDGGIECDADGWKRDRPDIGWIKELAIKSMEPFRREADADWFTLIGALGDGEREQFIIGTRTVKHLVTKSAEFCPFAQDPTRSYGNNAGRIHRTVPRIDRR